MAEASRARFRAAVSNRRLCQTAGMDVIESRHRPRSSTGKHAHSSPRLCLLVAGAFEETEPEGDWLREVGTLLLYPPGVEHENRFSDRGARCLNLELSELPGGQEIERRRVVDLGLRLSAVAMRLYDELRGRADRRALRALTERLVCGLSDRRAGGSTETGAHAERARRLVEKRAAEGIALAGVARAIGVSRFSLARSFRAETGFSVGEYRRHLQVRRARAALLSTDLSLSTIAYRAGFADQSHFTRVFKRWTGLPPGRYRAAGS